MTTDTIDAHVGERPKEQNEVPDSIGEFAVWDCPNDDTVVYVRTFTPHDGVDFPRLKEKVGITYTAETWDVTRSVDYQERGTGSNVRTGEKHETVVSDVQSHRCMGTEIESFEEALSFAETLIRGLSKNGKPNDVTGTKNPIHELFQEIRMEQFN